MTYTRKLLAIAVATGMSAMPILGAAAITFDTSEDDSIFGGLTSLPFTSEGADYCGPYASCMGDFEFRKGSIINQTKEPGTEHGIEGKNNIFLTVPRTSTIPAQATFDFGFATNSFGMLWGSVDSYNTFDLLLGGSLVGSVTGTQLASSLGVTTTTGAGNFNIDSFVRFDGVDGAEFDSIRFHTKNFGFESDGHHVGPASNASVPGPMPLALFAFGLVGIALFGKRRETQI
jgi:hypothetical protein